MKNPPYQLSLIVVLENKRTKYFNPQFHLFIGNGALVAFIVAFIVTMVLWFGIIAFSLWRKPQEDNL